MPNVLTASIVGRIKDQRQLNLCEDGIQEDYGERDNNYVHMGIGIMRQRKSRIPLGCR